SRSSHIPNRRGRTRSPRPRVRPTRLPRGRRVGGSPSWAVSNARRPRTSVSDLVEQDVVRGDLDLQTPEVAPDLDGIRHDLVEFPGRAFRAQELLVLLAIEEADRLEHFTEVLRILQPAADALGHDLVALFGMRADVLNGLIPCRHECLQFLDV